MRIHNGRQPISNYAIKPTPELALRSNRTLLPARLIAALGLTMKTCRVLIVVFGILPGLLEAKCERTGFDQFGRRAFRCDGPLELSDPDVREVLLDILRANGVSPGDECGFVGLGDDEAEAVSCAQRKLAAGKSFWIAFQGDSWDSEVWTVGARREDGSGIYFGFDSNVGGQPELNPTYHVSSCKKMTFNFEHISRFWCAE